MLFDKLNLACIDSVPQPKVISVKKKNLSFPCSELIRVLCILL